MSDVQHRGPGQHLQHLDSLTAPAPSPAGSQPPDTAPTADLPPFSHLPDPPGLPALAERLRDLTECPDTPYPCETRDFPAEHPAGMPDHPAAHITPAGAGWLASASDAPHALLDQWAACPDTPGVLPCGTVFDIISAPALYGRRILERLWSSGPGSGPVAAHHGRILLFAAPGTAQRLPALLAWEEWNGTGGRGMTGTPASLLCHGAGDTVTVPPPYSGPDLDAWPVTRWLVAPAVRHPWLPGPEVLLWACVRAARPCTRRSPQVTGPGEARGQH